MLVCVQLAFSKNIMQDPLSRERCHPPWASLSTNQDHPQQTCPQSKSRPSLMTSFHRLLDYLVDKLSITASDIEYLSIHLLIKCLCSLTFCSAPRCNVWSQWLQNTCYSSRESRFDSQHPHGRLQLSLTPASGDLLMSSPDLSEPCMHVVHTHADKIPIHINKTKIISFFSK